MGEAASTRTATAAQTVLPPNKVPGYVPLGSAERLNGRDLMKARGGSPPRLLLDFGPRTDTLRQTTLLPLIRQAPARPAPGLNVADVGASEIPAVSVRYLDSSGTLMSESPKHQKHRDLYQWASKIASQKIWIHATEQCECLDVLTHTLHLPARLTPPKIAIILSVSGFCAVRAIVNGRSWPARGGDPRLRVPLQRRDRA